MNLCPRPYVDQTPPPRLSRRVDDEFFKLSEMANFLDKMDQLEAKRGRDESKFGDDDDDDDEEEREGENLDLFEDPDEVCGSSGVSWRASGSVGFHVAVGGFADRRGLARELQGGDACSVAVDVDAALPTRRTLFGIRRDNMIDVVRVLIHFDPRFAGVRVRR